MIHRSGRAALISIVLAMSFFGGLGSAGAVDDEERAGARAAAGEGLKAFEEKRYTDAVDLFSRAESVVHSPVHLLYIARSQANLGALVKAQETYRKLTREELAPNAPAPFRKAVESAQNELRQLEPRLSHITVTVPGQGDTAVVEMDGRRVPPALIGVSRPVDPGVHKFTASAPGLAREVSVTVKEGERQNVVLNLEPTQASGAAPTPAVSAKTTGPTGNAPAGISGGSASTRAGTADQGSSGTGMRIAGWAGIGLGVVGATVGTIFLVQRGSKSDEANNIYHSCPAVQGDRRDCTPDKQSQIAALDQDAKKATTMAVVGYAVGGVGLIGGVTLLLLAPKSAPATGARLRPWLGWNSVGVTGSF
jgi:hypothetical protein